MATYKSAPRNRRIRRDHETTETALHFWGEQCATDTLLDRFSTHDDITRARRVFDDLFIPDYAPAAVRH